MLILVCVTVHSSHWRDRMLSFLSGPPLHTVSSLPPPLKASASRLPPHPTAWAHLNCPISLPRGSFSNGSALPGHSSCHLRPGVRTALIPSLCFQTGRLFLFLFRVPGAIPVWGYTLSLASPTQSCPFLLPLLCPTHLSLFPYYPVRVQITLSDSCARVSCPGPRLLH